MSGLRFSFLGCGVRLIRGRHVTHAERTLSLYARSSSGHTSSCMRRRISALVNNKTYMCHKAQGIRALSTSSSRSSAASRKVRGKNDADNMRIAYYMAAVTVMVFGVSYASVPLYKGQLLCTYPFLLQ